MAVLCSNTYIERTTHASLFPFEHPINPPLYTLLRDAYRSPTISPSIHASTPCTLCGASVGTDRVQQESEARPVDSAKTGTRVNEGLREGRRGWMERQGDDRIQMNPLTSSLVRTDPPGDPRRAGDGKIGVAATRRGWAAGAEEPPCKHCLELSPLCRLNLNRLRGWGFHRALSFRAQPSFQAGKARPPRTCTRASTVSGFTSSLPFMRLRRVQVHSF